MMMAYAPALRKMHYRSLTEGYAAHAFSAACPESSCPTWTKFEGRSLIGSRHPEKILQFMSHRIPHDYA